MRRRVGPRKVEIPDAIAPYSNWNPVLPGQSHGPAADVFVRSGIDPGPLPASDAEIAFAARDEALALDRDPQADQRAADEDLSRPHREVQPDAAMRELRRPRRLGSSRRARRMRRLRRDTIAGRCTAFPGAARTCWIRPGFARRGVRTSTGIAYRRKTPQW